MANEKLLRYAAVALTAAVVIVVLVWRDNPLDSDVETGDAPAPTTTASVPDGSTATSEPESTSTSTSSTSTTSTSTTTTSTTTTTEAPASAFPEVRDSGEVRAVVTASGVVLPVTSASGGSYEATSPCGNSVTVDGEPLYGANVVIDPGHGGPEKGTVAPNGLQEDTLNLDVAEAAAKYLEQEGATVVLTRTDDYEMLLEPRADLAVRLRPQLFISLHHNADADGRSDRPGSETYYQIDSPDSRRAAGLIWEELVDALDEYDARWVANDDAGAKTRAADDGGDWYGILRLSAGVPAVVSEAMFVDNPTEADLLRDPEVLDDQGRAIARAVTRYVTTNDRGSGFVDAKPREDPPAGSPAPPCEDPPLR